jgi:hypothetical protein
MLKDKIQTILNFKKATLKKAKSINANPPSQRSKLWNRDRRLERKLKKNFEWPIINRVDTHSDLPKNTHLSHDLMRMAHN